MRKVLTFIAKLLHRRHCVDSIAVYNERARKFEVLLTPKRNGICSSDDVLLFNNKNFTFLNSLDFRLFLLFAEEIVD